MTVKEDNYPVREACAENAPVIGRLQKGDPVRVRFAIAGDQRRCFSVTAESGGQKVQGYVWTDGLVGTEQFEQARKSAAAVVVPAAGRSSAATTAAPAANERLEIPQPHLEGKLEGQPDFGLASQIFKAAEALQKGQPAEAEQILARAHVPADNRDAAMLRASALLALNQFDRALEVTEAALKAHQKDRELLWLAGVAAYRLDDSRNAVTYLKSALEVKDDPAIRRMLAKVERETASDKSTEKSYGTRFLLRYEGQVADPELARQMVAVLEQEFSRVSFSLGCHADSRLVTIVQTKDAYRQTTGGPDWSGGQYDGKIRVPLVTGSRGIDSKLRRVFAHEIVHACMANLGSWPAWLHEGFAQKLSGDALDSSQLKRLKDLVHDGGLPKLEQLPPHWSQASAVEAMEYYTLALVAADQFFQKYGTTGARNLMNNPETLPQVTQALDKAITEYLGAGAAR
jgi:tetratricopeptide (TPR) repeat protein